MFLVHEKPNTSYLFASVKISRNDLAQVAVFVNNHDSKSFMCKHVVLIEPWDLGWPRVIQHSENHFMVTSATRIPSQKPFLWLYESAATDWPYAWRRRNRIIDGDSMLNGQALNPVLFFHSADSTWYLMLFDDGIGQERLYFSYRIHSGYLEHPDSQKYTWRHVGGIVTNTLGSEANLWAFVQPPEGLGNNSVIMLQIARLSRSLFKYKSDPLNELFLSPSEGSTEGDECHHVLGIHSLGLHRLNDNEKYVVLQVWVNNGNLTINSTRMNQDIDVCPADRWASNTKYLKSRSYRFSSNFMEKELVQDSVLKESFCTGDCKVLRAAKKIYAATRHWVILIVFNRAFIPLTKSWICNTEYLPEIWSKVLLISTDSTAVDDLLQWKSSLNVVHWDIFEDYSNEMKFGQVQYFRLMNRRLALTVKLLNDEIPMLIAETDAVWTSDALNTVPHIDDWDIAAGWDGVQYMMGFMFIRPTTASIATFVAIHDQYESILKEFEKEKSDSYVDLQAQVFAGDALIFLRYVSSHQNELKVIALDFDTHVGGKWYNEETRPKCFVPYTVQNNWLVGIEHKVQRMHSFGQWFLDDDNDTCISNSQSEILQSVSKWVKCHESGFIGMCGAGCIGTHANGRFWARPLDVNRVVYSFGIGEDLSFEIGLAARYGVTVHLYDPLPQAKDHFQWVADILERGWSDKTGPAIGNLSSESYSDLILNSAVKKEQLVFHQVKLVGWANYNSSFCIPRSSQGTPSLCLETNCDCEGELVMAQTLAAISKNQANAYIDLIILNLAGDEVNVIKSLSETEMPKYIMIALHDNVGNISSISSILTEYNLIKLDKRHGTWKLRRFDLHSLYQTLAFLHCIEYSNQLNPQL